MRLSLAAKKKKKKFKMVFYSCYGIYSVNLTLSQTVHCSTVYEVLTQHCLYSV